MSSSLNYWRQFLQTTKYDIFETIVSAIHLAATNYPAQFKDKQEYLKQTISTALSSNLLQCIPSEDKYNTKPKRKNKRKEKVIDQIFNKAKMNFVENWSSDDDDDDDDNACISDWMKKKSETKQRKRKGKRVVNDIKVAKRTSWRERDAHTETGSSSIWHMSNAIGIVNDSSATNLVAKEAVEVEVEVGIAVAVEVERDTLTKKSDLLEDVSKIRDALMKLKGQPVIAYDLLMRLDKMDISAHVLKVTEIAVIVSSFAKDDYCSDSLQTRLLASSLLESWRIILDKWLDDSNGVRDTEKVTVATEIVEPKSTVIEATKRTGPIQFQEGQSKSSQSSRPIFDIGSSSSGSARCIVAGQPTERYKNRQLTSSSQVQTGSSSRANNNTSLKSQPRYGLHQGPNLTIRQIPNAKNKMEVSAPAKKIEEVDRVRESLEIARRKVQERFQKSEPDARCMGACQPADGRLTGGSQIQFGGSSRAYGSTCFKSQPRYGLQGPKLTVKESLDDAKNKMKVSAPAEKNEEDPVRESLELAKRKLQERLHKSEQAKRHTKGLQNAD